MKHRQSKPAPASSGPGRREHKETLIESIAGFVAFFVYLLVLKSFFLPLFVIPTGSMAETLYGAHAMHTCPNCGVEYPIGLSANSPGAPSVLRCPNCRWQEHIRESGPLAAGAAIDASTRRPLHPRAGDRIMVHGWPYELGGPFAPQRWDVVVFKVPTDGQTNYIKRLIGKPGETIEIIDGDIFVTDPVTGETRIARKTPIAQRSLWFPYYDHDYQPRQPAVGADYHPRWVALEEPSVWSGLDTRRPRFDGRDGAIGHIQFISHPGQTHQPGQIADIYGYDQAFRLKTDRRARDTIFVPMDTRIVTDVRLSCVAELAAPPTGVGFVELSATEYDERFFARLYTDGRVTLEHAAEDDSERELCGERQTPLESAGVHLALSNADYLVRVELDGEPLIEADYAIDADQARARTRQKTSPRLVIAAQNVNAQLSHLLIERDVFYTSRGVEGRPLKYGAQGSPITLADDEYFLLGDNSPASLDARFSFAQAAQNPVGPHLKTAFEQDEYHLGTVPADQLIGPAFLVYWPGTGALLPDDYLPRLLRKINHLPSLGRVRWIH